jgi:hypothetical protein
MCLAISDALRPAFAICRSSSSSSGAHLVWRRLVPLISSPSVRQHNGDVPRYHNDQGAEKTDTHAQKQAAVMHHLRYGRAGSGRRAGGGAGLEGCGGGMAPTFGVLAC